MKLILILIITLTSVNAIRQDSPHVLHGLFYDSDETRVYYGILDVNSSQINIFNSLNIHDVGNPKYQICCCTINI